MPQVTSWARKASLRVGVGHGSALPSVLASPFLS